MAKYIKVESGKEPEIEAGAMVRLLDAYGSGTKYYVCGLSKGYCLIADNKRDFKDGVGYIHSVWNIKAYEAL